MKIGAATIYYKTLPLVYSTKLLSRFVDYIMISPIYEEVSEEDIKKLLELKEILDLEYCVHGLFPNRGVDPKLHGYKFELIKETIENAAKLESQLVIIHPSRRDRYKEDIKILKESCRIANDFGITLALENKPEDASFLKDEKDFKKLIEDIPDIKFCVDTSHFFLWSGSSQRLANLIKDYKEYITVFHIADARVGEDLQMIPGYGEINWYVVGRSIVELDLKKIPLILEAIYPADLLQGIKNIRHVLVENL